MSTNLRIETSQEVSYQENWTKWNAVREIIANAHDAQVRGADEFIGRMVVDHSSKNKILMVQTLGYDLARDALLMGTSGSRDDGRTIGMFGEGLPMSALVLSRIEGCSMTIITNKEEWKFSVQESKQWGRKVLGFDVRMLSDREINRNITVLIHGVSKGEWKEFKANFLFLSPPADADVFEYSRYMAAPDQLIMGDAHKGKIYVKGVYVRDHKDASFGYNLNMGLNRDRAMMDDWDLGNQVCLLVSRVAPDNDDVFDLVADLLEKDRDTLETKSIWQYSGCPEFTRLCVERFTSRHGDGAIPVTSAEAIEQLRHRSRKGVMVGTKMMKMLGELPQADALLSQFLMQPVQTYELRALTVVQRSLIKTYCDVADEAWSKHLCGTSTADKLKIVDYPAESTVLGTCSIGLMPGPHPVKIARHALDNQNEFVRVFIHEFAHLFSQADDGSAEHREMIEYLGAQLITKMVSWVSA